MNLRPEDFKPMIATVFTSQDAEVTLGRQPIMAEYGTAVRSVLNALPGELSNSVLLKYQEPSPQMIAAMNEAIIARETATSNPNEANLDAEWLARGGGGRKLEEKNVGMKDDWLNDATDDGPEFG